MVKFIELNSLNFNSISFKDLHNKKTLIVGNLGVGKTKFMSRLLAEAIEIGLSNKITVIDMAPPTIIVNGKKVGGTLLAYDHEIKCLRYLKSEKIKAPRLSSKNAEELILFAQENKAIIDGFIDVFVKNPSSILFINDISIYFHAGSIDPILEVLKLVNTFIANGYYGKSLLNDFGTGISRREMESMKALMEKMDIVIFI